MTKMVDSIKNCDFYYADMTYYFAAFASDKNISATAPLELVSIDLFLYNDIQSSTLTDIFSKVPVVFRCSDKRAETVGFSV